MTELNQENNGYSAMIHGKVYNPAQLVDRILELEEENEHIKELKKELSLEKAASEAQHKFIREYAGKGTEVQFNYAIDDAKEVSYVIVDKEEYNKNFEKFQ